MMIGRLKAGSTEAEREQLISAYWTCVQETLVSLKRIERVDRSCAVFAIGKAAECLCDLLCLKGHIRIAHSGKIKEKKLRNVFNSASGITCIDKLAMIRKKRNLAVHDVHAFTSKDVAVLDRTLRECVSWVSWKFFPVCVKSSFFSSLVVGFFSSFGLDPSAVAVMKYRLLIDFCWCSSYSP